MEPPLIDKYSAEDGDEEKRGRNKAYRPPSKCPGRQLSVDVEVADRDNGSEREWEQIKSRKYHGKISPAE
ncbi:hypothetical protein LZ554_005603 [Drepanopeziza brunnea f. sp. 'monogermtubi']|nr:hypothetical protein LZ554_005603 [Drepanopeziza brunnea f. sp. 'monogermtubi']